MCRPWSSLKGGRFERGDPLYKEWSQHRQDWHGHGGGMYISNGAAIAFSRRSSAKLPDPDLFCMALLAPFKGYYPKYSAGVCDPKRLDCLTWALLKAYTGSRGCVTLRSPDPRDRPIINFHYFEETGTAAAQRDVEAIIEGIKFVRKITARLKSQGLIGEEEFPGEELQTDEDLARHVRDTAWGHHASCTCPIGPEAEGGVLTSDFKVHGNQRAARRRRFRLSSHPRLLHRERDLYDRREGRRCHFARGRERLHCTINQLHGHSSL
jgi:choline dehydrogenase-like flavoprotein